MKIYETQELEYKVIDHFFPFDVFEEFQKNLLFPVLDPQTTQSTESIPIPTWTYGLSLKDNQLYYLAHLVYDHIPLSPLFNPIMSYCNELLDIKSLIRIKINLYPNTEIVKEHGMHTDYDFSHKAAILYINTCDGYTKLEDGTKIESVANRMLLFDGSKLHTPSTCTDQSVRMNINFNYF